MFECLVRQAGDPEPPIETPGLEPDDPDFPEPDPDVTDPPDDAPDPDAAFAELTNCIDSLINPDSNECSHLLRCADGSTPEKNDQGICVCPGVFSFPTEPSCDTLIDCAPDEPCECEESPPSVAPTPGEGGGTVLIIRH